MDSMERVTTKQAAKELNMDVEPYTFKHSDTQHYHSTIQKGQGKHESNTSEDSAGD